jgi:serine/threonine protein kinase
MEKVEGLAVKAGARVGDYVIEGEEGDGFRASHVLLPRRVRLVMTPPTALAQRPVAVRMMREACILEALRHPGVPRIFEVGVLDQRRWVASELIEGELLADTLAQGEYISVVELLEIVRDTAEVLAYAHARNVAHRGVRPEAIIRCDGSRGSSLCLVNWGLAHMPDAPDASARAFPDDVFALGLLADLVLGTRRVIMSKVAALVDDMLAPNPTSRPSAVIVEQRAKELLATLDPAIPEAIDEVLEERLMFAETSRLTPPPMPVQPRLRWTPATHLAHLTSEDDVESADSTSSRS